MPVYPYMPVRLISRLRYPVADYVVRVECAVLIVHSRDDEINPFAMGKALYEAASAPKAFLELEGDHNNEFLLVRNRYREKPAKFVADYVEDGTERY